MPPALMKPYIAFISKCIVSKSVFHVSNDFSRLYFFLTKSTLETVSHSPNCQGYSNNFVPQKRRAARRDNVLLLSLLNQTKSFPEIFSTFQMAFVRKEKDGYWKSSCCCFAERRELITVSELFIRV